MSAREIIAKFDALPAEEKAKVIAYFKQTVATKATLPSDSEIRYVNDEKFEKVKEEVFTKHAELLRKLAD